MPNDYSTSGSGLAPAVPQAPAWQDPRDVLPGDGLGIQSSYAFRVVDSDGSDLSTSAFAGLPSWLAFRMPPQALQIQRSIRAEVLRDIGMGSSVVTGGEGIGSISLQGTHGVGKLLATTAASAGFNYRNAFATFFATFVAVNEARGRLGQGLLRLIFEMSGGNWSNPSNESYYVWPRAFPSDSRTTARPHAWDWAIQLDLLDVLKAPVAVDKTPLLSPAAAAKQLTGLAAALQQASAYYKQSQSTLQAIRDVVSSLKSVVNAITVYVQGAKDAIYAVTDLVNATVQNVQTLLQALNPADFANDVSNAFRSTLYNLRATLGHVNIAALQFQRTGQISPALTAPQTVSVSRPTSVALNPKDTLAGLAQRLLGDSSRWPDLAAINHLAYPFLDFSGPNGAPDPSYAAAGLNVLGSGGILKLPLPAVAGTVALALDPFGSDLPDDGTVANVLVGGLTNLSAALQRRLLTLRGRIPWHPAYGSLLPRLLGGPMALANVQSIQAEVYRCLQADARVLSVLSVTALAQDQAVQVEASVNTPLGPLAFSLPLAA